MVGVVAVQVGVRVGVQPVGVEVAFELEGEEEGWFCFSADAVQAGIGAWDFTGVESSSSEVGGVCVDIAVDIVAVGIVAVAVASGSVGGSIGVRLEVVRGRAGVNAGGARGRAASIGERFLFFVERTVTVRNVTARLLLLLLLLLLQTLTLRIGSKGACGVILICFGSGAILGLLVNC